MLKNQNNTSIACHSSAGLKRTALPIASGNYEGQEKPLEELELDDLDLDEEDAEPKMKTIERFLPPKKEAGKLLQGEPAEQAKELVSLLRSEAKVI